MIRGLRQSIQSHQWAQLAFKVSQGEYGLREKISRQIPAVHDEQGKGISGWQWEAAERAQNADLKSVPAIRHIQVAVIARPAIQQVRLRDGETEKEVVLDVDTGRHGCSDGTQSASRRLLNQSKA